MTQIILQRRRFLAGMIGLVAAPAIVRIGRLMRLPAHLAAPISLREAEDRFHLLRMQRLDWLRHWHDVAASIVPPTREAVWLLPSHAQATPQAGSDQATERPA